MIILEKASRFRLSKAADFSKLPTYALASPANKRKYQKCNNTGKKIAKLDNKKERNVKLLTKNPLKSEYF